MTMTSPAPTPKRKKVRGRSAARGHKTGAASKKSKQQEPHAQRAPAADLKLGMAAVVAADMVERW